MPDFGADPFGAFMATRRPAPSVLDDVRGTEVDPDPFGAFMAHRARTAGMEKFDTAPRRAIDYFMEGQPVQDYIGAPIEDALNNRGYGRTSAAVEGVARQMTPLNMSMIGLGAARGAAELPDLIASAAGNTPLNSAASQMISNQEALRMAELGLGGLQTGEGAAATKDAIDRRDWKDAALSGGMTALGALGAAAGLRPTQGRLAGEWLPPARERGVAGEALPPDIEVRPRITREDRMLESPVVDQPPSPLYDEGPGDPIQRFLNGRTEEPRGLYPPGLPPGPDLPPDVAPGKASGRPEPTPGDQVTAPPPVTVTPEATRTAPAEDPGLAAQRAFLKRQGYPDPLIDTLLQKLVNGESEPAKVAGVASPIDVETQAPFEDRMAASFEASRKRREAYDQPPVAATPPPPPAEPTDLASALEQALGMQEQQQAAARAEQPPPAPGREGHFKLPETNVPDEAFDVIRQKLGLAPTPLERAARDGGPLDVPAEETFSPQLRNEFRQDEGTGVDSADAALEGLGPANGAPERGQPDAGGLEPRGSATDSSVGSGTRPRPRPQYRPLIDALVADAKAQGHVGPDDELRALLEGRVNSAHEYLQELKGIKAERGDAALLRKIAELGGLRPFEKDLGTGKKLRGDYSAIAEGIRKKNAAAINAGSGKGYDQLADELKQFPEWAHMDEGELRSRVRQIASGGESGNYEIPGIESVLRGADGIEMGAPWWKKGGQDVADMVEGEKPGGWGDIENAGDDERLRMHEQQRDTEAAYDTYREHMGIPADQPLTEQQMVEAHGISVHDVPRDALSDFLDTGEEQPRLPGDVGDVRNAENATPREDAPFALERENATRTAVQPRLGEADPLEELLRGDNAGGLKVAPEPAPGSMVHETRLQSPEEATALVEKMKASGIDAVADGESVFIPAEQRAASDKFFESEYGSSKPAAKPEAGLDSIVARHDVRDPEKVTALATSMRENGWQGRPALIVEKDGVSVAWTATHRLEAAKQAGLGISDVPMVRVDGAALERAGYNLDELTNAGKKARIEALRKSGQEEAAKLLEDERQGSPARMNAPAGAAAVDRVPPNVYDYVTRQLGWTREDLAGKSATEIYKLGRDKVRNPDAPLRSAPPKRTSTLPEGESYNPENLSPIDADLERFLSEDVPQRQARADQRRSDLIARQGVELDRVHRIGEDGEPVPATKPARSTVPDVTKRDALATRNADRSNAADLQREIAAKVTRDNETPSERQSRVAKIQSTQRANAKEMGRAFDRGDYKRFGDLVGEAVERFWNRQRKMGSGEPGVRRDDYGDILEGGVMPGFSMLGKILRDPKKYAALSAELLRNPAVRALIGAAAGYASGDTTEESLNRALQGAALAALAPSGLRALKRAFQLARDGHAPLPYKDPKSTDIAMWRLLYAPSPERTVPELFTEAQGMLDRLQEIYAQKGVSTTAKIKAGQFTKRELAGYFQDAAEEARAAGLKRKAWYADAISRRLAGKQTAGEKVIAGFVDPIFGKGEDGRSNFDPRLIERHARTLTYRTLVGYALDTAVQNLTQPVLALLHVSPSNLRQGYAAARTDAGKALAKGLELLKPTDVHEDIISEAKQIAGKGDTKPARPGSIRDMLTDPGKALRASDNFNRRVVYLAALQREGALRQALRTGEVDPAADAIARSIVRRTQGNQGPLGNNPFHKGPVAGTLSSFQKFPGLLIENILDAFNDPKTRGRAFVASMMGLVAAGQMMGISTEDLLVGGRPLGIDIAHPMDTLRRGARIFPAGRALGDIGDHLTGKATHPIAAAPGDGFLDSDLATLVMGRYPVKATKAIADVMREGLGTHKPDGPRDMRAPHTGMDDLLSLVGLKSTARVDAQQAGADASRFQRDAQQRQADERKAAYSALDSAMKSGDQSAIASARQKLSPSQLRAYDRAARQTPYERRRARVPAANRSEFDQRFKDRLDR